MTYSACATDYFALLQSLQDLGLPDGAGGNVTVRLDLEAAVGAERGTNTLELTIPLNREPSGGSFATTVTTVPPDNSTVVKLTAGGWVDPDDQLPSGAGAGAAAGAASLQFQFAYIHPITNTTIPITQSPVVTNTLTFPAPLFAEDQVCACVRACVCDEGRGPLHLWGRGALRAGGN